MKLLPGSALDLVLLCFAYVFFTNSAFANSYIELDPNMSECPYDPNKKGGIKLTIVEPDYDDSGNLNTSHTLEQIRAISSKKYKNMPGKVVAFADVKFSVGYEFSTKYFKLPKRNTECHWIESITFKISFQSPPTILFPKELYQAREQDGGVCYDQIYAHEMQHIQDYERVFEEIVVTLDQDERLKPGAALPTKYQTLAIEQRSDAKADNARQANQLLQQLVSSHYESIISRTVKEIQAEMAYLGNALDSTMEYQRITELCSEMHDYIR